MMNFAVVTAASMMTVGVMGTTCDIYGTATPCVAAHSTVRALYKAYDGPLYVVKRDSDGTSLDIGLTVTGGTADSAAQDAFCAQAGCTVERIYDQSPFGNHLDVGPQGGAGQADVPVNATRFQDVLGGSPVYAAYFEGGMGYRKDDTKGIATGDEAQSMYMVVSGKHYNNGCCFDYGNAETDNNDDGAGTMEAIYFGNSTGWGRGTGSGPWVMADIENCLSSGSANNCNDPTPTNIPVVADYVTAMVKGKANHYAIKGGDAQNGGLTTMYDGGRPKGYNPMKKQGAIILGVGGDNSNRAVGTFYEGVMTMGYCSSAVDDAVQANIVAAGYGR